VLEGISDVPILLVQDGVVGLGRGRGNDGAKDRIWGREGQLVRVGRVGNCWRNGLLPFDDSCGGSRPPIPHKALVCQHNTPSMPDF